MSKRQEKATIKGRTLGRIERKSRRIVGEDRKKLGATNAGNHRGRYHPNNMTRSLG